MEAVKKHKRTFSKPIFPPSIPSDGWLPFKDRLRLSRERVGLTQEQVAEQAGYDVSVVSNAESGLPIPRGTHDRLLRICKFRHPVKERNYLKKTGEFSYCLKSVLKGQRDVSGDTLRAARELKGLSIQALADKLQVSAVFVEQIEKGAYKEHRHVCEVFKACGLSQDWRPTPKAVAS